MQAGLNLFSVRNLLDGEQGLLNTCRQLKEDGYSFFQFSGLPFDGEMIKRVQDALGIPFILTHVPLERILQDTDALIDEHLRFGCTNIGLGFLPWQETEEAFYKIADQLNEAGKRMQEKGCTFFYHAHHHEFIKFPSGKRFIDYMIENCPYIHFTADTYWIQYAGCDICEYFEKMSGRIECVHLKDYMVVREGGESVVRFAPVGMGNLNFAKIVETAKRCGTKYFLVEQDNAAEFENPLAQTKISIDRIKNWRE